MADFPQDGRTLPELAAIMRRLLDPGGCPWDRQQTHQTLTPYVIEEAFEVVEAIEGGSMPELREELGDLLLQVVFHAELAARAGHFGLDDVVAGISDKMTRRHPHVFGDAKVDGAADVVKSWDAIKAKEKADRGALDGVPVALPSLLRAVRLGEKAGRRGYDWPAAEPVRDKVSEELAELDAARAENDRAAEEKELGDVLFALASYARHRGLDPEAALRGTLDRFTARFRHVETEAKAKGEKLVDLDDDERERRWEAAKKVVG